MLKKVLNVGVIGAAGRMGKELVRIILESPEDYRLTAAIEAHNSADLGKDAGILVGMGEASCFITSDINTLWREAEVGLDFVNTPEVILQHCQGAAENSVPLVIGTTGIKDGDKEEIRKNYAIRVPIFISSNMSFGMNLLFSIIKEISSKLEDYDVEILEMHHNAKLDAPSGTAIKLYNLIKEAREKKGVLSTPIYGREGKIGARKREEIGIFALRGGDVVGEHTVIFAAKGERLELTHRVSSRRAFAEGALKAAKFLVNQPPGLYETIFTR
jgi:4-hydroxy-tetrahydrodipicolinate reductase